jgi:hypothetical protein
MNEQTKPDVPNEENGETVSPAPQDEKLDPRLRGDDQAADPDVALGETEAEELNPRLRGDDSARGDDNVLDIVHVKRVLEAALLSSMEPLTVQQLKRLFGGEVDADNIRKVLEELRLEWSDRSIELTPVASGWRFRV